MTNRDRYDLIQCVLRHLLDGKPRSSVDIMYSCHLSNAQSHTVTDEMLRLGLIVKRDIPKQRSRRNTITAKGRELLKILDELNSMTKNGLELSRF